MSRDMLRFVFKGYSIWLELEQVNGDIDIAIALASKQINVHPIPTPHVTVIYGMNHLSEDDMKDRFQSLKSLTWPPLEATKLYHGVEYHGVDCGTMVSAGTSSLQYSPQKIVT